MISIFPFSRFEIKTNLSKQQILDKFSDSTNVVSRLSFSGSFSGKPLNGIRTKNGFQIRRNIRFGFSALLPTLSCKVKEYEKGMFLDVYITFDKKVNIMLVLFFLFQISLFLLNASENFVFIGIYTVLIGVYNLETMFLRRKFKEVFL